MCVSYWFVLHFGIMALSTAGYSIVEELPRSSHLGFSPDFIACY